MERIAIGFGVNDLCGCLPRNRELELVLLHSIEVLYDI